MTTESSSLAPLVRQKVVLLTTYRRDGTPVSTPVNIAVDGERAFVRTWHTTSKLKRIRHTPDVEITPSTNRGKPTGPAIRARARLVNGDEAAHADRLIVRKYPILHGYVMPLVYRLRRTKRVHLELTPI